MNESKSRQRNVSTEHLKSGCGEYALGTVGLDGRMLCPPACWVQVLLQGVTITQTTPFFPLLSTIYSIQ
jgi:hypothetical protein